MAREGRRQWWLEPARAYCLNICHVNFDYSIVILKVKAHKLA
jgi:hypothetical protein